jgi:drug/metabolite transporter (DMT)-like permease
MQTTKPSRWFAIGEAVIVNLIWASTFVLVKIGLENKVGPLTLAGLRYFGGFVLLLPLLWRSQHSHLPRKSSVWVRLVLIGVSAYTLANGALFWGLQYIPATTGSLLLNFIPVIVLVMGIVWLKEIPTLIQVSGVIVAMLGSVLFFSPGLSAGDPLGITVVSIGLLGFGVFGILGREVARDQMTDTLSLTAIPLAFGGGLLLLIALPVEGLPQPLPLAWLVVGWLALVNTAFAYVVYYHALQTLTAFEANMLTSLAPVITAALAFLFLGETLESVQFVGMLIVLIGVFLSQWRNGGQ